ncbi:MAG: TIGR02996 domain-containing protein, partial [Deltaproteobacteria bacterium]|nr:TIGR02996 domain-containing protein [Deltaproteobacteria bacterium]
MPSPAEEAALAAVEARFAGEVAAQREHGRGAAEFLADIYAHPDDDDLRRVFADWLLERGDARGELIALQLSGARTEASARREAALIARHGAAWAGPLDACLAKEGRTWARGFLSGGLLDVAATGGDLPPALSDPAWATLRELALPWNIAAHHQAFAVRVVDLPWVRALHALRGMHEATAAAVLFGEPRPRLREAGLVLLGRNEEGLRDALALGDAVPNLERLTINERRDVLPWLLATPLAKRLVRLTGRTNTLGLSSWIGAVALHAQANNLPLREIALEQIRARDADTVWRFVATRDDGGRFRRLRAEPVGASTLPDRHDLVLALASLPRDGLVELVVPPTRTNTYGADDITLIERALARFGDGLRVDVPWPRLPPMREPAVALELHGDRPDLAAVWEAVQRLPRRPAFDAWEVDARGHRPLPAGSMADALAHVIAQLKRPRTQRVRVYESAGSAELLVTPGRELRVGYTVPHDPAAIDAYVAWVVALVDELRPDRASCLYRETPPHRTRGVDGPRALIAPGPGFWTIGWIELFGGERRHWLPHAALAELPADPALAWLRVEKTRAGALLV